MNKLEGAFLDSEIIWSDVINNNISINGKHYAVLYNNMIYDNITLEGVTREQWLSKLAAPVNNKIISLLKLYKDGHLKIDW